MQKLYGRSLRQDAGLVKSIKRSLPDSLKAFQGSMDKILDESIEFVEEVFESARPKLPAGVTTFVKDTTALIQNYPARITVTRIEPDLAGYDLSDYSLEVEGAQKGADVSEASSRNPENMVLEYGAPIKVKWTAPLNHGDKDWVGLYMITHNSSREITKVSSQGRWVATNKGTYDSHVSEMGLISSDVEIERTQGKNGETRKVASGEMVFSGDKLWWTQGVFEFRYHHNGKHNVMAISRPFEIRVEKFDEEDVQVESYNVLRPAVESALLPVVQNCFDRDAEIAPQNPEEPYGAQAETDSKYAKRVVLAVHHMFGVEFAPEVVRADGSVRNLAWRICNAKKVLAPYSMSGSSGTTTPTKQEH